MVGSPVLFIAIPLLAAFLIPLLGFVWKESIRVLPGLVLIYLLALSVSLLGQVMHTGTIVEVIAGWKPPWGIDLVFSPFTGLLTTVMLTLGFIIWIYSYRFKNVEFEEAKKYFILFMMLITGSVGIVLTGDIFNQFVFIEITSISAYALTAFYKGRDSAEASFKYLMIGSLSSMFLLLAIILIYSQTGTLNMADIAVRAHDMKPSFKVMIVIFFLTGLGIEAEIFPLNGWAPDAYSQAPGPIGAAFAGITVKAGVYALIRIIFTLFDVQGTHEFLIVIGLTTLIIAELSAIRQVLLKRMLAYSSIGQMGLVLVAFGLGTREGVFAALFLMVNHAIIKSLLFLSGSYLVYNSTQKFISEASGMGKHLPITSFLFSLGAIAIVGMPPFAGFWSKWSVLSAASDAGMITVIVLILLVSIVEVVYYFRVINQIYFSRKESHIEPKRPTVNALIAMISLGLIILVIGFWPDTITGYLQAAADTLMDKGKYIHDVLSTGQLLIP